MVTEADILLEIQERWGKAPGERWSQAQITRIMGDEEEEYHKLQKRARDLRYRPTIAPPAAQDNLPERLRETFEKRLVPPPHVIDGVDVDVSAILAKIGYDPHARGVQLGTYDFDAVTQDYVKRLTTVLRSRRDDAAKRSKKGCVDPMTTCDDDALRALIVEQTIPKDSAQLEAILKCWGENFTSVSRWHGLVLPEQRDYVDRLRIDLQRRKKRKAV